MARGKLVTLKATNLKDPTEMSLDTFANSIGNNITVLADLSVQPAGFINKLLPFLVHGCFGLWGSADFGLVHNTTNQSVLFTGEYRDASLTRCGSIAACTTGIAGAASRSAASLAAASLLSLD